jgi:hypothetical protein
MRLRRTIKIADRYNLQFLAEGFNISNRTNYARVNNVVGATLTPPFSVHVTNPLSPSQPLGFTSANSKREIQLGIRLDF